MCKIMIIKDEVIIRDDYSKATETVENTIRNYNEEAENRLKKIMNKKIS